MFDYIICHGIYSWVPAPVREKILAICRDNLAGERRRVRQLQHASRLAHARHDPRHDDLSLRAVRGREGEGPAGPRAARFPGAERAHEQSLRHDAPAGARRDPQRARRLSVPRASRGAQRAVLFPPVRRRREAVRARVSGRGRSRRHAGVEFSAQGRRRRCGAIATDIIRMEQYMDFVRNRMFRQTLLVHRGRPHPAQPRRPGAQGLAGRLRRPARIGAARAGAGRERDVSRRPAARSTRSPTR